jgi:hypothetical protein
MRRVLSACLELYSLTSVHGQDTQEHLQCFGNITLVPLKPRITELQLGETMPY